MNRQMLELMQRRGELLGKIAAQRERVAGIGMHWQMPLSLADKGIAAVRFLRSRPVLVAGAVALFVIRRRGVTSIVSTGWRIWKLYRSSKAFSAKIASHLNH